MSIEKVSLVVYVDVDDTLIRTAGSKQIPVSGVAQHVSALAEQGAVMYCWSSGGADYARRVATDLGIAQCFVAFLPKPNVMLDDQNTTDWRRMIQIHPGRCTTQSVESYWASIEKTRGASM